MPVLCATRAVVGAGCPVPVTILDAVGVSLSGKFLLIPGRHVAFVLTYTGLLNTWSCCVFDLVIDENATCN